jgi:hypothetical protein
MKPSQIFSVLAAAPGALAQNYTTSPGFKLSVTDASNSSLNGYVVSSCHSGAAIESLCIGPPSAASSTDAYGTYYFNYTSYSGDPLPPTGVLFWNLPYQGENGPGTEQEPLSFLYNLGSNVATPLFEPSEANVQVGFDSDNKLFAVGFSDSSFTAAKEPNVSYDALYHWEACYQYIEGYYYQSIAWVLAGTPSNPTCGAVNVTRTFL